MPPASHEMGHQHMAPICKATCLKIKNKVITSYNNKTRYINKTNYEECIKKYEQNYTTIYDNINNKELFIIEFNNNLVTFI